ncbi:unnamed protein product [Prorocentrum cordatum]|uniref:Uncharacterized protein n=1 Tax=Prorocentrum cordatum TaxID=2364126 RepID=A0ABN9S172_9DINO|nr:unnamed protein product [Polarella glacialis]
MKPPRSCMNELRANPEELGDPVRRCKTKRSDGHDKEVNDDAKIAALETTDPEGLELHLAVDKTKLDEIDEMMKNTRSFLNSRRSQGACKTKPKKDRAGVFSLCQSGHGSGKHERSGGQGPGRHGGPEKVGPLFQSCSSWKPEAQAAAAVGQDRLRCGCCPSGGRKPRLDSLKLA